MTISVRISSKGQVVVPKSIRDKHGWTAGTELELEDTPHGIHLREPLIVPRTTIDQVAGMLKYDGPPLTLEDMERAIEEGVAERWGRKAR